MLCRGVGGASCGRKGYRRFMAGIESGSDASGAVPLVKVLSRRQCRRMFSRYARRRGALPITSSSSHVFPSRAPSTGARRRRLEKWAGHWGWYLTIRARR